jgi:hypothetical protein
MSGKKSGIVLRLMVLLSFIAVVFVNALANILPINGVNTGELSDMYKNLFVPAGITFSVWGVIYILLFIFVLFSLGLFKENIHRTNKLSMDRISVLFIISSIANVLWILVWHYKYVYLSLFFMIIILVCLILIGNHINKTRISPQERLFVKVPFGVYFGWITVATIANVIACLVDSGFTGLGIPEKYWTILIIATGALIAAITIFRNRDVSYGLTVIWAYTGIYIKHTSSTGFAGKYPDIIISVYISVGFILLSLISMLAVAMKKRKSL